MKGIMLKDGGNKVVLLSKTIQLSDMLYTLK